MKKLLFIAVFMLVCQVSILAQTNLHDRLQLLLQDEILHTSDVGIAVYDLTAQCPVFAYQDEKLFRPASVLKLMTVITALKQLGPDYPFTTRVLSTGSLSDGVLNGNLYVIGAMDAELAEADMDALAHQLVEAGIRKVDGMLYGDVSLKDSLYWGAGWAWDDTPYYFQPYLSPLMFHKGVVDVLASPTVAGKPARIQIKPVSDFYSLRNLTCTQTPSAGKFDVTRNWLEGGNVIQVSGNVHSRVKDRVNMYPSADFFLYVFRERLALKGVEVGGYALATCPSDSVVQVASCTHTLHQLLEPALKRSDNLNAEAIFYHLAVSSGKRHVNAEDAATSVCAEIARLGYSPESYRIADGSGVSPYNFISPRLLLSFLCEAYTQPAVYEELLRALPLAGVDGTLRNRMKKGVAYKKVYAKTGSLTGVSSLAGYATSTSGHQYAFVIINQNILKASEARAFQNKFCEILCK